MAPAFHFSVDIFSFKFSFFFGAPALIAIVSDVIDLVNKKKLVAVVFFYYSLKDKDAATLDCVPIGQTKSMGSFAYLDFHRRWWVIASSNKEKPKTKDERIRNWVRLDLRLSVKVRFQVPLFSGQVHLRLGQLHF